MKNEEAMKMNFFKVVSKENIDMEQWQNYRLKCCQRQTKPDTKVLILINNILLQ